MVLPQSTLTAALCVSQLIGSALADNPLVQTLYTADPAPIVHDNRLYLFTSHDEDGAQNFDMRNWRLYSTNDMANWQDHGSPAGIQTFSWADENAWAAQAVERNGKFYLYVPIHRRGGGMAIGVAVSDAIEGPYVDPLGAPLLENAEIDPTVFIDDDGQAYLYWGNPGLWYVKLNDDMISYSGDLNEVELTVEGFGPPSRGDESTRKTAYEEGPWLFKRIVNGSPVYYMLFAANCCAEDLRYSTSPSPTGPWTYGGVTMASKGSFTNHPGYVEYEGQPYYFYHTGDLEGGGGFTRSVAAESFQFNADGSIPEIPMTENGPAQTNPVDPYVRQEAELIAWAQDVRTEPCAQGGMNVAYIYSGSYIKVKGVDFGSNVLGPNKFTASVASNTDGGNIEVRLDDEAGQVIAICAVENTGGWQEWQTESCEVAEGVTGMHDLFFVFVGTGGPLLNFDWWQFE